MIRIILALIWAVSCIAQSISPSGLTLTGTWTLDGAIYGSPQVVASSGCIVVATMGGSVYCADPSHPGVIIWRTHLSDPQTTNTALSFFGKRIGCLSKPAIDVAASRIYAVCASPTAWVVYVLDMTGTVLGSTPVAATVPGTGCGSSGGNVAFSAAAEIQRPALLLNGSTLVVAFGSNSDQSPWHGWLLAYDVSSAVPLLIHTWLSTPNSCGGAIWQSAGPPVTDGSFYYIATGNGTGDHSMQVVKLDLSLNVVATWTPVGEGALNAADADVASGAPMILGSVLAIGFKDWHARLLFLSDLSLAADVPTNPSPPALDGDRGIYGGLYSFDGGEARVYFPNKPGPVYAFTFTSGGLTPLSVGSASYGSTMSLAATSGVLWAVTTDADPYAVVPWRQVTGTLRALDPATLVEFWHADIGQMASFSGPGFADDRVYVGNSDGVLRMFSHDAPVTQPARGNSISIVGWSQN